MAQHHKLNRAAFFKLDASSLLLQLYLRLVALELALKDHDDSNRSLSHNVVKMVQKFGDASANIAAVGLDRALSALKCTARNGTSAEVLGDNYPAVRYLRHENDFAGETTDLQLKTAVQALESLLAEVMRLGVTP